MTSSQLEEDKNVKKKNRNKDVRKLFRLKKGKKVIKDRILREIGNLFEHE